ncbi:MAG TPA: S8 family serine peptidase, partial [Gemmatimonadaceae bacterium]|nr:S8 family serine peptidase [Gemmatimonadaceae bacterium]
MSIRHLTALSAFGALALAACGDQTPVAPEASPSLSVASSAAGGGSGTYLVRFTGNGVPRDFATRVKALGGQVIFAHAGAGVAAVSGFDDARAGQIAARSDVAAVDADMVVELDEPATETAQAVQPESPAKPATAFFYPRQWNMRAIGADRAWAAGKLGSPEVTVGILDTGIDYRSPDLAGLVNLPLSKSFLSKAENDRVQRAFPGAHEVADLHYHGTHVAAT